MAFEVGVHTLISLEEAATEASCHALDPRLPRWAALADDAARQEALRAGSRSLDDGVRGLLHDGHTLSTTPPEGGAFLWPPADSPVPSPVRRAAFIQTLKLLNATDASQAGGLDPEADAVLRAYQVVTPSGGMASLVLGGDPEAS